MDDLVRATSGALVGRLDHVFKGLTSIVEAQIVQREDSSIIVRLVAGDGFGEAVRRALIGNIRERLGNLRVDIEEQDRIPRGPNGKFRAVVSRVAAAGPGI